MKKTEILCCAIALLAASCTRQLPSTVDMPYYDGNTFLPATELMQVERTDSTTVLTFMTMYDYYDFNIVLGDETYITTPSSGNLPLQKIQGVGSTRIENNRIMLKKGIPSEYKMIFPAIDPDAVSLDFVQKDNQGKVLRAVWGIDLTGKRAPGEYPADVPAELYDNDLRGDTLPRLVTTADTATVNIHVAAWRNWMSTAGDIYVNTIADTQEHIPFTLDDHGTSTVKIPLEGTANIVVNISTNTYASTYVAPGETMDIYLLPDNRSESQRWHRPAGVTNGKYRILDALSRASFGFQIDADTLLIGKTDPDQYFVAMMQIHSDGLDSLRARNYDPIVATNLRAWLDRQLMYQMLLPDSVVRFTPAQIAEMRAAIDFDNPLLELKSIGNPGNRTRFLQARRLLN